MKKRMTPHPMRTYTHPVPKGSDKSASLPRVFIHCSDGSITHVFAPFAKKAEAAGWQVRTIATGHMAMISAPRQVAELLDDIADGSG